jgi:glycosyltransferase involved in cell wall biosynthesis
LQRVGKKYQLVCTGDIQDFRFPGYYDTLLDLIGQLGIKDDVRILGHIPKLDQIALLKNSIAVIQPTLFEGGPGGGASYDAISLGKPLIVSDIPVNQEIDKDVRVFFFEAKNVKSLAEKMNEVANNNFTTLTNEELYSRGLSRKKACGEVLLDVIKQAVS